MADLWERKTIVSGSKRGTYRLQESIHNFVEHFRKLSTDQEGEDNVKRPQAKLVTREAAKL
jgi:hypothetical protein